MKKIPILALTLALTIGVSTGVNARVMIDEDILANMSPGMLKPRSSISIAEKKLSSASIREYSKQTTKQSKAQTSPESRKSTFKLEGETVTFGAQEGMPMPVITIPKGWVADTESLGPGNILLKHSENRGDIGFYKIFIGEGIRNGQNELIEISEIEPHIFEDTKARVEEEIKGTDEGKLLSYGIVKNANVPTMFFEVQYRFGNDSYRYWYAAKFIGKYAVSFNYTNFEEDYQAGLEQAKAVFEAITLL